MMFAAVLVACAVSCKDPVEPTPTPTPTPVDTTDNDLSFDKPTCDPFTHQIVDGGFENCWYKVALQNEVYVEYQSSLLYSLNSLHALMEIPALMMTSAPYTAYRERTDPHGGTSCMKLVSGMLSDQSKGQILVPGAIAPLDENFVDQFLNSPDGMNVKHPYSDKPTAFKGFYKYAPVNADKGSVRVELYAGNNIIARGYQEFEGNVNSWTAFNVPIDYTVNGGTFESAAPTHISIVISSSAGYDFADLTHCTGEPGSTLWVDDIEFEF